MSPERRLSFTEDAEIAAGATGLVIATDQGFKSVEDEKHRLEHIIKAGVGAAVAIGAYEMLRRAEHDPKSSAGDHPNRHHHEHRHSNSSSSGSNSHSSNPPHHTRHLVEEIIGLYALGKELMGDKRHHIVHLVGEAIGATGLVEELSEMDKMAEEKGDK